MQYPGHTHIKPRQASENPICLPQPHSKTEILYLRLNPRRATRLITSLLRRLLAHRALQLLMLIMIQPLNFTAMLARSGFHNVSMLRLVRGESIAAVLGVGPAGASKAGRVGPVFGEEVEEAACERCQCSDRLWVCLMKEAYRG